MFHFRVVNLTPDVRIESCPDKPLRNSSRDSQRLGLEEFSKMIITYDYPIYLLCGPSARAKPTRLPALCEGPRIIWVCGLFNSALLLCISAPSVNSGLSISGPVVEISQRKVSLPMRRSGDYSFRRWVQWRGGTAGYMRVLMQSTHGLLVLIQTDWWQANSVHPQNWHSLFKMTQMGRQSARQAFEEIALSWERAAPRVYAISSISFRHF